MYFKSCVIDGIFLRMVLLQLNGIIFHLMSSTFAFIEMYVGEYLTFL